MASPTTSVWQTGTEPQRSLRMALGGHMGRPTALFAGGVAPTTGGGAHGVVGINDLAVTVPASSLVTTVAAGGCFVSGTSAIGQGSYYWYQDTSSTVTLAAYNTSSRTDLVGVWVRDNAEDSGGATSTGPDKVTGTPGGGVPTVPAGFLVLAQAAVPANSGTVVLTDKRRYAAALGGFLKCLSTEHPTGVARQLGLHIFETDTGATLWWDGSVWRYLQMPAVSYTPTSSSFTVGAGGVFSAGYSIVGNQCNYSGSFTIGTGTSFGASPFLLSISAPQALAAGVGSWYGGGMFQDNTPAVRNYPVFVGINGSTITLNSVAGPQGQTGQVDTGTSLPFPWTNGDKFFWFISYPIS